MKLNYFFIILIVSIPMLVRTQDIIQFADGKQLECKIEGITDSTLWIIKSKGKRIKENILPNADIFSVILGDSNEIIIYKPDTSDTLAFSIEQMRSYVAGATYARIHYKSLMASSGAFIAGVGGGLLGYWGLLIPLAYDLGIGYFTPNPKNYRKEKLPQNINDFFILGYQDVSHKRKTLRLISSSISGIILIAVYTTIMSK